MLTILTDYCVCVCVCILRLHFAFACLHLVQYFGLYTTFLRPGSPQSKLKYACKKQTDKNKTRQDKSGKIDVGFFGAIA